MHFPLFLFFLLLPCTTVWSRLQVYSSMESTTADIDVPTQSFFQGAPIASPPLRHSGVPITMQFKRPKEGGGPCEVRVPAPNPELVESKDLTAQFNETIVVAEWKSARKCGLQTFSQIFPLAEQVFAALPAAGAPPGKALVIVTFLSYPGLLGNPNYEPYTSKAHGVSDALPPSGMDVYILPFPLYKNVSTMGKKAKKEGNYVLFVLEQERGPWNDLFQAWWFRSIDYVFLACNACVLIYALYWLYQTIREGDFHPLALRNAIFLLGFAGLSLYDASLLLRFFTRLEKILSSIATWFITLAFHMLLYLWSKFLQQLAFGEQTNLITAFRILIYWGGINATAVFIWNVVQSSMPLNPTMQVMARVISTVAPLTQACIAGTFLYFALRFQTRGEASMISSRNQAALTRLSRVAMIAFFGYFLVSMCNMQLVTSWLVSPGPLATVILLRDISAILRGVAVLTVLGIRTAVKKGEKGGNVGGSSGFSSGGSRSRSGSTATTNTFVSTWERGRSQATAWVEPWAEKVKASWGNLVERMGAKSRTDSNV